MTGEDPLLLKISRRSMATDFELMLHRDLEARQVDEAVRALDWLEQIEAELTVYSPHSAVSRLNKAAVGEAVKVPYSVFDVLAKAQQLAEMLEGAFDVTAGPLVEAWGFTTRSGKRPTAQQIQEACQSVGWSYMDLDRSAQTITFQRAGMRINLGAIGKGYALDRVAARLESAEIKDFLLHGGNSSILARGHVDRGSQNGWLVGLTHPVRPGVRLGGVRLIDQALATSGSGKRFFHFQGKRYGHVIDPRTGMPTGDSLALTVLGPDATTADAVATGLYVAGMEKIEPFTVRHPEFEVLAMLAGQRPGDVELRSFNLKQPLICDRE